MTKKNNKTWYIIGGIVLIVLVIILFKYNSFKNQEAGRLEYNKINSVKIIDVGLINTPQQEANQCTSCRYGYITSPEGVKQQVYGASDCKAGSLKLTFHIYTNKKDPQSVGCKIYNNDNIEPDTGDYIFDPGLNVYRYAWRDYSQNPQRYKVCCTGDYINNEPAVCSEEYSYNNPC